MSIIRVQKNKNYTTVNNHFIRNRELSAKAKGLMCTMLSLSDDWKITTEWLITQSSDGKDAIRSGLKELEIAGYLVISHGQDQRGKFTTEYDLYEEPQEQKKGTPLRVFRNGKTAADNPPLINTRETSTKTQKGRKEEKKKRLSYDELLSSLVDDPNVREALAQYIQMRIAKKSYPTNAALELLVKRLQELSKNPQEQVKIVEQATRGGYMDFKPLSSKRYSRGEKPDSKPRASMERFDPDKDKLATGTDGKPLVY